MFSLSTHFQIMATPMPKSVISLPLSMCLSLYIYTHTLDIYIDTNKRKNTQTLLLYKSGLDTQHTFLLSPN